MFTLSVSIDRDELIEYLTETLTDYAELSQEQVEHIITNNIDSFEEEMKEFIIRDSHDFWDADTFRNLMQNFSDEHDWDTFLN